MSTVEIKQLKLGPMANFVYILSCPETKEAMVVDPAWDIQAINQYLEQNHLSLKGILVTHYHPDHIGGHLWGHDIDGVADLLETHHVPVFANKHEAEGIRQVAQLDPADLKKCESGDDLVIGKHSIKLIHTPGHTPGSQCFLCDNHLVAGDTLFIQGCGRVDLPGGDVDQMYDSLTKKIAKLPPNTILYPGHHYDEKSSANLGEVTTTNPVFALKTREQFRKFFQ